MFCVSCGYKLEETMKFCPRCGAKVVICTEEPKSEEDEKVMEGSVETEVKKVEEAKQKEPEKAETEEAVEKQQISVETEESIDENSETAKTEETVKEQKVPVDEKKESEEPVNEYVVDHVDEAVEIKMEENPKMYENSETFLREWLGERKKEGCYTYLIGEKISKKQITNAADKIAGGIDPSKILALVDTTLFSSGKEGVVYTGTCVYLKCLERMTVELTKLKDVELYVRKEISQLQRVLSSEPIYIKLIYEDREDTIRTGKFPGIDLEFFAKLVKHFIVCVKDAEEKSYRYSPLSELNEGIKKAYILVVCAYLKSDDGIIDSQEYKELVSLMARIKISKEVSREIVRSRFNLDNSEENIDFEMLIEDLHEQLRAEKLDSTTVDLSLFKELLLMRKDKMYEWKNDEILEKLKQILKLDDNKIECLIHSIEFDEKIVNERVDNNQIKEYTNELAAIAGGAGVTMAALMVTGGVSTGIWGGLWTLSMLSGGTMFLGLATIGGLSYGAYKGIKLFSGVGESEKYGVRIVTLQNLIEENKRAMTYIIEDMNYLTGEIKNLFEKVNSEEDNAEWKEMLQDCIDVMSSIGESGQLIEECAEKNQYEAYISKLPLKLNYDKFIELIKGQANREEIETYILEIYKVKKSDSNQTTEQKNASVYERKEELSHEDARKVAMYLENIGYFDTKDAAVAQGKALAKKGINSFKKNFLGR